MSSYAHVNTSTISRNSGGAAITGFPGLVQPSATGADDLDAGVDALAADQLVASSARSWIRSRRGVVGLSVGPSRLDHVLAFLDHLERTLSEQGV